MNAKPRVIVVGGGVAGLAAALRVAESGLDCDLVSIVPRRRSHSVSTQGGLAGALDLRGEGDSPARHFEDTIRGGDFLADQALVKAMCEAAPGIIRVLDRMGVPFDRTREGLIDLGRSDGTLFHRSATAGGATGQKVLYALDEQVRRGEDAGRVTSFERFDFLSAVLDEGGVCRGIVAMDLMNREVRSLRGDAVVLATGGPALVFGRSTASRTCTGAAAAAVFRQGARYANGEFIQVHPTAIPGGDKDRAIPESVRGEGGRLYVVRDGRPWYFLEERHPRFGDLVPRDIAAREIDEVVRRMGLGIDGEAAVHLDVTHLPDEVRRKFARVLETCRKFAGEDPARVPMSVRPSVHASMGGLWTYNKVGTPEDMMTSVRGLYAAGECAGQFHGANRLGGNSLLSRVFAGLLAGSASAKYVSGLEAGAAAQPASLYAGARRREEERLERLARQRGNENPFRLHEELGEWMTRHVTLVRRNEDLARTDVKIQEIKERLEKAALPDDSEVLNESLSFMGHLDLMLDLARVITIGALKRDESRGAHYKPEFPERDDERFLKTTIARYAKDGPEFAYEAVDTRHLAPGPRVYD